MPTEPAENVGRGWNPIRHLPIAEMMPGALAPTKRDVDWVFRIEWIFQLLDYAQGRKVSLRTRSKSCSGICSATATIRGISASMASSIAVAACCAATYTAVASGFNCSFACGNVKEVVK